MRLQIVRKMRQRENSINFVGTFRVHCFVRCGIGRGERKTKPLFQTNVKKQIGCFPHSVRKRSVLCICCTKDFSNKLDDSVHAERTVPNRHIEEIIFLAWLCNLCLIKIFNNATQKCEFSLKLRMISSFLYSFFYGVGFLNKRREKPFRDQPGTQPISRIFVARGFVVTFPLVGERCLEVSDMSNTVSM